MLSLIVYKTKACYSYNTIYLNGDKIKVASIDTILSFLFNILYMLIVLIMILID